MSSSCTYFSLMIEGKPEAMMLLGRYTKKGTTRVVSIASKTPRHSLAVSFFNLRI